MKDHSFKAEASASIDWEAVKRRLAENQASLEQLFVNDPIKNQRIFQERAKRMAERVRSDRQLETVTVMRFQLGKERYALPLSDLAEIIPFADYTPIPGTPRELKGAISIRGEIHCVIDLASLLGVTLAPENEDKGYILILRHEHHEVGLKVCHVHQVDSVEKEAIDKSGALNGHYARGVGNDGTIFLNLSQVLNHNIFKGVA